MRNLQRPIDWFYHEYLYVIVRFEGIVHFLVRLRMCTVVLCQFAERE